jgi:hypothetical protein
MIDLRKPVQRCGRVLLINRKLKVLYKKLIFKYKEFWRNSWKFRELFVVLDRTVGR